MNIAFRFVILMSQNNIWRNKQYQSIWKTFIVLGTIVDVLLEKTVYAQLGHHRYWKSHGRLDKTVYDESCVIFLIFHAIRICISSICV